MSINLFLLLQKINLAVACSFYV